MKHYLVLFSLILAGEMIFCLPFHLTRFFRTSFLDVFSLSNTSLGDAFAFYGVMAMICYFPGGVLADKIPTKKLIFFSLIATSLGGFFLLSIPNEFELSLLYGYWGITTILFFWAALIKATKLWGGDFSQGKAFGILEGGRGLAAAIFSSVALMLFSFQLETSYFFIENDKKTLALQLVIFFYSFSLMMIAFLTYFVLPNEDKNQKPTELKKYKKITPIFSPRVWLMSGVIICAYCGFKSLDNITLYLHKGLGWSEIDALTFSSLLSYLRPIAAITFGIIVDKLSPSIIVIFLFFISVITNLFLSNLTPGTSFTWLILVNIIFIFLSIYALRGIYFSLLKQIKIPNNQTGIAVGIVSVIGYTPDVFFAPLTGRLLDASPGITGYQSFYFSVFIISILGLLISLKLHNNLKNN